MRCVEARLELAEGALGAIPGEVAEHVERCPGCAGELAALAAVIEATKRAHAAPAPAVSVTFDALERACVAARTRGQRRAAFFAFAVSVGAAAVALGFANLRRGRSPEPARDAAPPPIAAPAPALVLPERTELERLVAPRVEISAEAQELPTLERAAARPFADVELSGLRRRPLAYEVADLDASAVDRVLAALPRKE
jgi:hypothetical protein